MKLKTGGLAVVFVGMILFIGYQLMNREEKRSVVKRDLTILNGEEDEEIETSNTLKRERYEWLLLRDPRTGKIPDGIRNKELT